MASDARAIWDSLTAAQQVFLDLCCLERTSAYELARDAREDLQRRGLIYSLNDIRSLNEGLFFRATDLGRAVVEAGKAGETAGVQEAPNTEISHENADLTRKQQNSTSTGTSITNATLANRNAQVVTVAEAYKKRLLESGELWINNGRVTLIEPDSEDNANGDWYLVELGHGDGFICVRYQSQMRYVPTPSAPPRADSEAALQARVSELEAAIREFFWQSQRFTVSKDKLYADGETRYPVHECPACHAYELSHMSRPVEHKADCPMAKLANVLKEVTDVDAS